MEPISGNGPHTHTDTHREPASPWMKFITSYKVMLITTQGIMLGLLTPTQIKVRTHTFPHPTRKKFSVCASTKRSEIIGWALE